MHNSIQSRKAETQRNQRERKKSNQARDVRTRREKRGMTKGGRKNEMSAHGEALPILHGKKGEKEQKKIE